MRFLKSINHPHFKIGLYQSNNKFIIKLEAGMCEQTYKIDEYEVSSVNDLDPCLDQVFLETISLRFEAMHQNFSESLQRNGIIF
jgi:uncharacterized protein YktB (UPF0637 family)